MNFYLEWNCRYTVTPWSRHYHNPSCRSKFNQTELWSAELLLLECVAHLRNKIQPDQTMLNYPENFKLDSKCTNCQSNHYSKTENKWLHSCKALLTHITDQHWLLLAAPNSERNWGQLEWNTVTILISEVKNVKIACVSFVEQCFDLWQLRCSFNSYFALNQTRCIYQIKAAIVWLS